MKCQFGHQCGFQREAVERVILKRDAVFLRIKRRGKWRTTYNVCGLCAGFIEEWAPDEVREWRDI